MEATGSRSSLARPAEPAVAEAWDAVVVGAGMSGLAAGIRLAHFGKRVVVLERHYLWGGLNSFYKRAGRNFDTGLHALTNFVRPRTPGAPLLRILRQLRLGWDDLQLEVQSESAIAFPDLRLRFSNDPALFEAEVERAFPAERDGFRRLAAFARAVDPARPPGRGASARAELAAFVRDPRLVDALLVPTCYYGSAREDDVDWDLFLLLYRAIFLEGLARPRGGVRRLLDLLRGRLAEAGGELRLRAGVARVLTRPALDGGPPRAVGVELEDGAVLRAPHVLSSAGRAETLALCGLPAPAADLGRLSFFETVSVLDRPPAALGHTATMVFFNDAERFRYAPPGEPIDPRRGVVCCPDNYGDPAEACEGRPGAGEGTVRVTALADPAAWRALAARGPEAYAAAKEAAASALLDVAARHALDPRPHTVYRDTFTPETVKRYTGHANGAVYGSPRKSARGETPVAGLHLVGTDQGGVGIVGALLSGIDMANTHVLAPSGAPAAGGLS